VSRLREIANKRFYVLLALALVPLHVTNQLIAGLIPSSYKANLDIDPAQFRDVLTSTFHFPFVIFLVSILVVGWLIARGIKLHTLFLCFGFVYLCLFFVMATPDAISLLVWGAADLLWPLAEGEIERNSGVLYWLKWVGATLIAVAMILQVLGYTWVAQTAQTLAEALFGFAIVFLCFALTNFLGPILYLGSQLTGLVLANTPLADWSAGYSAISMSFTLSYAVLLSLPVVFGQRAKEMEGNMRPNGVISAIRVFGNIAIWRLVIFILIVGVLVQYFSTGIFLGDFAFQVPTITQQTIYGGAGVFGIVCLWFVSCRMTLNYGLIIGVSVAAGLLIVRAFVPIEALPWRLFWVACYLSTLPAIAFLYYPIMIGLIDNNHSYHRDVATVLVFGLLKLVGFLSIIGSSLLNVLFGGMFEVTPHESSWAARDVNSLMFGVGVPIGLALASLLLVWRLPVGNQSKEPAES